MIIKTMLCFKSRQDTQMERLGIDTKEKYSESSFTFNLNDVTGIDSPTEEEPEYFVIFLKGANGLLIHHDYDKLLKDWQDAKAH